MRDAARMICENYQSILPTSPEELLKLPGIGPATAASIAAFAFNKPTLFLETNIRTVFIYHFFHDRATITDADILPLAMQALDKNDPRKWYSALMDYGTMLKRTVGNLSKQSASYQKQTPFSGSRRQIRGKILKLLVTEKSLSVSELAARLCKAEPELVPFLLILTNEGMITKAGKIYRIAQ